MPPPIHPETIIERAEALKTQRVIQIEATLLTYFGDFFHSFQHGLNAAPVKSARIAPANTASAHYPS
jgi:hypothetical protein